MSRPIETSEEKQRHARERKELERELFGINHETSPQDSRTVQSQKLLANLKAHHAELAALLQEIDEHDYEDTVYRFYHGSFKVYGAPSLVRQIVDALRSVAPEDTRLSPYFEEIMDAGAEKRFEREHNQEWTRHTRPFLEAFFHARYFLEMAVKYGDELDEVPYLMPSGWAVLLCLYGIR